MFVILVDIYIYVCICVSFFGQLIILWCYCLFNLEIHLL